MKYRRTTMGNIISLLQEIFMMKGNNTTKVGLAGFKESSTPVEKVQPRTSAPKELKISDLMRRG